jgi:ribosomal protein S18 acetylase RimI-like enzyme
MAARCETLTERLEIVDLRHISGRQLEPLLLEETVEWERELDWDFSKSAELVSHFTDSKALTGFALLDRNEVVGYVYSVVEDHKGLIGDFYIRTAWRDHPTEVWLFRAMLNHLTGMRSVRRIESQLLMMTPQTGGQLQQDPALQIYERLLLSLDCESSPAPPVTPARNRFHIEAWGDHLQESAATVIVLAYKDHIDSRINDQYSTLAGARRFVTNIVQFPGCGTFYRPASMLAFNPGAASLAGMVLTSFVAPRVGHITQLCVTPDAQGSGLGRELLTRANAQLRAGGAKRITLTVTHGNAAAIELYRTCGFREVRRFAALARDSQ